MCGTNFSAFWTSFETLMTQCIETLKMLQSFGITDFITDLFILVIPMPLVSCADEVAAENPRNGKLISSSCGS